MGGISVLILTISFLVAVVPARGIGADCAELLAKKTSKKRSVADAKHVAVEAELNVLSLKMAARTVVKNKLSRAFLLEKLQPFAGLLDKMIDDDKSYEAFSGSVSELAAHQAEEVFLGFDPITNSLYENYVTELASGVYPEVRTVDLAKVMRSITWKILEEAGFEIRARALEERSLLEEALNEPIGKFMRSRPGDTGKASLFLSESMNKGLNQVYDELMAGMEEVEVDLSFIKDRKLVPSMEDIPYRKLWMRFGRAIDHEEYSEKGPPLRLGFLDEA